MCDLLNCTLCPKNQGQDFHNLDCIERNCPQCGVQKFKLSENELSCDELAPDVEWMCYEYVKFKFKNTEKKKLCLVKKKTKPGSMFKYFYDILSNFSSHVFRSKWQSVQLQYLKENLPQNHVICIHDFSENYACKEQVEIQSNYFQRTEASLHVSIIYRHAIPEIDGQDNSEHESKLIEEHFFGY